MANNQILASDNFASGALASGWVVWPNASGHVPQIVAASPFAAESFAVGTTGGVLWTGLTWPTDQISEVTLGPSFTATSNNVVLLFVRVNGAGTTGYQLTITGGGAGLGGLTLTNYFTGATINLTYTPAVGATILPGDVFTLAAQGAAISIYQNSVRLAFAMDASIPSGGSPGFAVRVAAGTIGTAQVAAWRGYSSVQQDGIWQKQAIVLAPLAADSPSTGFAAGSCIYDTNPQLIGGTNCYKLWLCSPNINETFYAESPDLINWTRRSSAVLAATGSFVIKVGSTFYLYTQLNTGTGGVYLYTSPDGITWTQQSTDVLSVGAGGTWDAASIYSLRPITVIGGTWYALYAGSNVGVDGPFKIGLATSTDGAGLVWTKYSGNPVLGTGSPSLFPYQCFTQVGNTFYHWFQQGPSSPQSSSAQAGYQLDPNEVMRFSTTDFIHWTAGVKSIHRTEPYEALNFPTGDGQPGGGTAGLYVTNIGGVAYMLTGPSEGDIVVPDGGQYALAIGPSSLANIVTQNEDAVKQVATDSFTSGTGSLSANWTTPSATLSALKIVSGNLCESTLATSALCGSVYTGATFLTSQYAEITLSVLSATGAFASPAVMMATATGNHYRAALHGATGTQAYQAQIVRNVAGVDTKVGPIVGITPQVADVIRLSVVQGTSGPVVSLFQNGSLIIQYVDQGASALLTGNPGIVQAEAAAGTSQLSLWAGGNANVIPAYAPANNSNNVLLTPNNVQVANSVIYPNALLTPNLLGGTPDWS